MVTPVKLYRPAASRVAIAGRAVSALYGPLFGGLVTNPSTAEEQGLDTVEVLWVDITTTATLGTRSTSVPIQPGQSFYVVPNQTTNVSVNAATAGHRFSAIAYQEPTDPPTPFPSPWPPTGPTSLTAVIPSYLYQQYKDDDDLLAFVRAHNELAQGVIDWFNEANLPIYTGLSGPLLDWVAEGLYGMVRPTLSSGANRNVGPLNTYGYNSWALNAFRIIGPTNVSATSDDIFKRIITWAFFKGDGAEFNVRFLKRRVMRFLLGTDGVNYNVDQTYQVSVTFAGRNQVNITLINGFRTITGGALLNRFGFNQFVPLNSLATTFTSVTPLPNAAILKQAIDSGALELPFQYEYVVTV